MARRAGQQGVLRPLDAVLTGAIHVDVADQLGGEGRTGRYACGGIDASRLGQEADSGERQRPDHVRHDGLYASLKPDPGLLPDSLAMSWSLGRWSRLARIVA